MSDTEDYGYINYNESRTINIGNYENVKTELRYGSKIAQINEKERTMTIGASETVKVKQNKNFAEATKLAMGRVKSALNAREADIRLRSAKYIDDYLPEEKLLRLGLLDLKKFRKKRKEFEIEEAEINEYFKEEDGFSKTDDDGFEEV